MNRAALPAALVAALCAPIAPANAQSGGDPGTAPAPTPTTTIPPRREPTAAEIAALEEVEQDFLEYRRAADLHDFRIRQLLHREFLDRQANLQKKYAARIEAADAEKRKRTLEAIALLEKFLVKYPDHQSFTPDAMFRLADLYIERAEQEYEKAHEMDMLGFKDGTTPAAAPDAGPAETGEEFDPDAIAYDGPDYEPAMGLWRGILERFPEYRQRDGVMYLLGYYLGQVGRERESKQVYLGLVCTNKYNPLDPPPPALTREEIRAKLETKTPFTGYDDCEALSDFPELVEESWVRGIADAHFNQPGELPEAIAAYKKAALNKESKYYDEALYKLAWSYYRNDDFLLGIEAFDESVAYSDKMEDEGKDPLDLRGEAITYIAISFTDPWSVEEQSDPARSLDRANAFYKGRESERHVRDVYDQLGDTFKVIEAHEQAIDSWRTVLKYWPLHPMAPRVHQKIVSAFEAMGDRDAADEEAAILAETYAKGTEWYKANETNREAMEDQARIGQRMLRATAENTHRAAQIARKDWEASQSAEDRERFIRLYNKAGDLYALYLQQYPDSNDVYEFTYRIADTKFFAEEYMESVPHYRWVREHRDMSDKYYLKSAVSIVQAYQAEVDKQLTAGTLVEPPIPTADSLKALGTITPMNIPQVYVDLREAYDEYQRLVEDPKTAPTMALAAALVSYRHLHLDDAITRFEIVMDRFCGSPEATQAKDGLLVIYEARRENEKFTATNEKFISSKCGDEESIAIAKAQNRSMEFTKAEQKFEDKNYAEAAIEFYRYYKTAPDDDPNLPIALYNSAIAYERSGRPKTAIFLFNEFTSNPDKKFRDSEYYVEALYLTAVAHQKAFDYESAVQVYLDVTKVAAQKGRKEPPGKRSLMQIRLDALFNAALLRELDRVYKDPRAQPNTGAVSLYRRYYNLEKDPRKKDRALWAIARVYESARNTSAMVKAYDEWRKRYGRNAGNEQDYVFTYYNTAKKYETKGSKTAADKARRATIKAWEDVGKPQGTPTAEMAAEMEFYYAENHYKARVERFKFSWPKNPTDANVKKTLDSFDKLNDGGIQKFAELGKYQSAFYGFAALVRIGDIRFFAAQKLINAPPPKEITRLDNKYPEKGILTTWQEAVEAQVKPLNDQAIVQWKKVVSAAKDQGVKNKWTNLAQERLHDFVDSEAHPVLRDDKIGTTETP